MIEPLFGMKITDVLKRMYLAQSKDESQIPFFSRPCPKACQLKNKRTIESPSGRAEMVLKGKYFH